MTVPDRELWLPPAMDEILTPDKVTEAAVAFQSLVEEISNAAEAAGNRRHHARFQSDDILSFDTDVTALVGQQPPRRSGWPSVLGNVTVRSYDSAWVDGGAQSELTITPYANHVTFIKEGTDQVATVRDVKTKPALAAHLPKHLQPVRYHSGWGEPAKLNSIDVDVRKETMKDHSRPIGPKEVEALGRALLDDSIGYYITTREALFVPGSLEIVVPNDAW